MHTRRTLLSHTTPILILIRAGMDHKDGKVLPQNTTVFLGLELKTSGYDRRDPNHLTYMFDGKTIFFFFLSNHEVSMGLCTHERHL